MRTPPLSPAHEDPELRDKLGERLARVEPGDAKAKLAQAKGALDRLDAFSAATGGFRGGGGSARGDGGGGGGTGGLWPFGDVSSHWCATPDPVVDASFDTTQIAV